MPVSNTNITGIFTPLRDGVLVRQMEFGEIKTRAGVIIPGDDAIGRGIHPRWAEVIAIGHKQEDVNVGQWVLVAHGRWSRGFNLNGDEVRTVDPKDILMINDEEPTVDFTRPSKGHQTYKSE
jgi:co-chaperonin GroES (HSP10)